ncbi:glycosyl transferase family 2 [Capsulimonas corticalis]|uniref:Glycosyl transferase family 2 n=1 Tax=Capsulimonas corticalis TaxID=2219043 RepID=A0A402CU91_9BACT|nr:glycosyltransferase family 2 protein [Capsulimonas corticalis]BDI28881.1 glycosyl transferase family 2 [Capsulimonas corticalis]
MNVLLLMAGSSDAFKDAGYLYPKNLVEIDGLPLIQRVMDSFAPLRQTDSQMIGLVRREENEHYHTGDVLRLLDPPATILTVPSETAGAACTALLAIEQINNDEPLLIANGDQILTADLPAIVDDFRNRGLDGGIVVFEAVHPRWSYVQCDADGYVIETAEKRPISNMATAGVYYFARGADFVWAAMEMIKKDAHVEGRFFICPSYNELILRQAKIGVSKIPRKSYFSLTNPQGVQSYEEHLRESREH